MQKSRLIEVLRTFSKKEFRELRKWFASPAHNQRQDVIDLYEYLLKNTNLFNEKAVDKAAAFKAIYPNEVYDDAKMRQVMHFMFKALESFLAYSSFINSEDQYKISLLKIYRKRNIDKAFSKTQKELDNYFKNTIHSEEGNLYKQYLFHKEIYEFNSIKKRTQALNLQEITDIFDQAFIAEKLKQACLILSHQKVYQIEYDTGLLENILSYIDSRKLFQNNRISIYYYLYKITLDKNNIDDFYTLKNYIQEDDSIPKNEIRSVYLLAINFCISLMNTGNEEFISEAFELYKAGIDKRLFFEHGNLSRWTFRNVIAIALRLKEFSWAEDFINSHGQYLEEKHKESVIRFNLAKLFFEKNNYDKAMDLVNQYEFKDVLENLNAKTMLLKMYYELSEFKALESLLESMRAYLQRKKELGNRINGYKNIVRYTKKLLKVNPYNKEHIAKLRLEIEEASPLTEKTWLLKQLDQL